MKTKSVLKNKSASAALLFICTTGPQVKNLPSDQGQNPLNKAQSAWEAGNLESLLSSLQKNFTSPRSQEWDVFGSGLRQAASKSAAQNDWPKAYQLYLAATLANPADAWAQRGLEQARRNYILATN